MELTAEYEATDCRNETRKEWIERECADKTTVNELNDAGKNDVQQVGVDQFQLLRCIVDVVVVEFVQNYA